MRNNNKEKRADEDNDGRLNERRW